MTIKTNEEGKVILQISANVDIEGATIIKLKSELPINEAGEEQPEDGVIYVDAIPGMKEGYELHFDGVELIQKEQPNYAKVKELRGLKQELADINKWFQENDLKSVVSFTTGDWSTLSKEWIGYLSDRLKKKARQGELLARLKGEER